MHSVPIFPDWCYGANNTSFILPDLCSWLSIAHRCHILRWLFLYYNTTVAMIIRYYVFGHVFSWGCCYIQGFWCKWYRRFWYSFTHLELLPSICIYYYRCLVGPNVCLITEYASFYPQAIFWFSALFQTVELLSRMHWILLSTILMTKVIFQPPFISINIYWHIGYSLWLVLIIIITISNKIIKLL